MRKIDCVRLVETLPPGEKVTLNGKDYTRFSPGYFKVTPRKPDGDAGTETRVIAHCELEAEFV